MRRWGRDATSIDDQPERCSEWVLLIVLLHFRRANCCLSEWGRTAGQAKGKPSVRECGIRGGTSSSSGHKSAPTSVEVCEPKEQVHHHKFCVS